jgi:hypothetical protein
MIVVKLHAHAIATTVAILREVLYKGSITKNLKNQGINMKNEV